MAHKNNQTTHPAPKQSGIGIPQFCHLHFDLCTAKPLILPNLPRIPNVIMQNKPNSRNLRIPTPPYDTKTYTNIPPNPAEKNKPNQTQLVAAQPLAELDPPAIGHQGPLRGNAPAPKGTSDIPNPNREPGESAKMAQKIDPTKTSRIALKTHKHCAYKQLRRWGRAARTIGTRFAHKSQSHKRILS